ncbi:MAG: ornithine cyclodeaminase family protein [Bacteroidales bacterium]|nr:ornithine cyclodeaminase family protein [Bacteroidales bacterium]
MLVLNDKTIANLTDPLELTGVIEDAMLAYADGDFVMPDRVHMDFGNNTLLLMPSSSGEFFSTKLVSLFPDNPQKGAPVLFGSVVLNDGANGKPLALINGAKLTAVRTAAVGSTGIKYTAPENASTLGLVGAGVQGFHQVLFACRVRKIKQVWIYDAATDRLNEFILNLKPLLPDVEFNIAANTEELCLESEIIITATNADAAVLPEDSKLLDGKTIVAIGSYKPDMIEMPEALYPLLDNCFIDVEVALEESGDLIHPIESGILKKEQIHLLSELITKKITIDTKLTTLYKSVGMALFDLFTAIYLFKKARETGSGQEVNF